MKVVNCRCKQKMKAVLTCEMVVELKRFTKSCIKEYFVVNIWGLILKRRATKVIRL